MKPDFYHRYFFFSSTIAFLSVWVRHPYGTRTRAADQLTSALRSKNIPTVSIYKHGLMARRETLEWDMGVHFDLARHIWICMIEACMLSEMFVGSYAWGFPSPWRRGLVGPVRLRSRGAPALAPDGGFRGPLSVNMYLFSLITSLLVDKTATEKLGN